MMDLEDIRRAFDTAFTEPREQAQAATRSLVRLTWGTDTGFFDLADVVGISPVREAVKVPGWGVTRLVGVAGKLAMATPLGHLLQHRDHPGPWLVRLMETVGVTVTGVHEIISVRPNDLLPARAEVVQAVLADGRAVLDAAVLLKKLNLQEENAP